MSVKIKSQKSFLTGEQITDLLRQLGVAHTKFMRDTGLNRWTAQNILSGGSDGDIPKWVELVLILYIIDEEARTSTEELELPLEDYGLRLLTPSLAGADRPAPEEA